MTASQAITIIVICLILLAWIASASLLNTTRWWLCPMCWHWWNHLGEKQENPPMHGSLESKTKCCADCAAKRRSI